MDVVIISGSRNRVQPLCPNPESHAPTLWSSARTVGRTYRGSVAKLRQGGLQFTDQPKKGMKERRDRGRGGHREEEGTVGDDAQNNFTIVFLSLYLLSFNGLFPRLCLVLCFSTRSFPGALTCSGPPAGMVDLSDVRSMSRPGSPLSVFPIPCIIRPEATLTHTPRSKNANGADGSGRYEEGNYTGCQAPSARRRPERTEGRTNNRLIHPPSWPPPPRSLSLHSFRMVSLSLSPSLYSPSVSNQGYKNGRETKWTTTLKTKQTFLIPSPCTALFEWPTTATQVGSIYVCLPNRNIGLCSCLL